MESRFKALHIINTTNPNNKRQRVVLSLDKSIAIQFVSFKKCPVLPSFYMHHIICA